MKGGRIPKFVAAFKALSPTERKRWLESKTGFRSLSSRQRRRFALYVYRSLFEPYITNPKWAVVTMLEITRRSLQGLKQFIEDPVDEISWAQPAVELQFPVDWDWSLGAPRNPHVRDADLRDWPTLLRAILETFLQMKYQRVSEFLTKGAALIKKAGVTTEHIAPWVQEMLDEMTEAERGMFLEDWGMPFILGAVEVGENELELQNDRFPADWKAGDPLPEGLDPNESALGEKIAKTKPFLPFRGEVDGSTFSGSVVVSFNPLVVDEDLQKAYYPVQASIHFHPGADGDSNALDPSSWAQADREEFWKELLGAVDQLISRLGSRNLIRLRPSRGTSAQRMQTALEGTRRLISDSLAAPTAPISAWDSLSQNLRDVTRLAEIHEKVGGSSRGRRYGLDVLNRSGIVLVVASWEAFVEDLVTLALERILAATGQPSHFPKATLLAASRGLRAAKDERRVLELAGDGWRGVVSEYCSSKIRSLNSPTASEVEALFQDVLGLVGLTSRWKWGKTTSSQAAQQLDALVKRRHAIAHRVSFGRITTKKELESAVSLVLRLAEATTRAVSAFLGEQSRNASRTRP